MGFGDTHVDSDWGSCRALVHLRVGAHAAQSLRVLATTDSELSPSLKGHTRAALSSPGQGMAGPSRRQASGTDKSPFRDHTPTGQA